MRNRGLLCWILALTAPLFACSTPLGTRSVDRPTQDRRLLSTHYELVPDSSPVTASPLRLRFEKVERYRIVHAGERVKVETYSVYKPYHELWEVPLGAFTLPMGLAFFFLDDGASMLEFAPRLLNPAQNLGSGEQHERDLEVTPLPERIEEKEVRTPVPEARVQLSLAGLPSRELRTGADGALEVPLPHLVTRPFRGLPNRIRARAGHPSAGPEPVATEVEVAGALAKRLAVAAPAALSLGAASAPLGEVAGAVFTLKRLGFGSYADALHERALSRATAAPPCGLGAGGEPWVYAAGACRDGLADGPGEAYSAAGDRRLRGEFRAGQLVRGRDEHVSGRVFSGEWRHFRLHGAGSHREDGELQYEGRYADGARHGDGTCLFEGRYERCEHRDGQRVDQVFVMREELRRSRAEMAKMQQEQKRMLEAQAEEARRIAAEREALERQRAEAARRQQQAQQGSSGPDFGQMVAFGLGAAALGAVDVPLDIKTEAAAALAEDILGGGNGAATDRMRRKYESKAASPSRSASGSSSGSAGSGGSSGSGYQSATIKVSCSANPFPIKYKTAKCRTALTEFTQAYVCNELTTPEKQRAVESRCMQACGNRQCAE